MGTHRAKRVTRPFAGEDLEIRHWEDARHYTAAQITGLAWSDAALFPEEVRNYVLRLSKILARLEIPCDLVNRPGRAIH
jgi:hypothetical protein